MVRGGKEGRVYGPLPVNPYHVGIVRILIMEKGMNILVVVALKGPCKEWIFLKFNPERVMKWYGV